MPPRVAPVASCLALVPDVAFFEVPYQFVNAAEFQVSPEDQSDQLSFFFDDRDLALFHLVAKRQSASDPKALSLGGSNLVADPLGGDLPFKLGKGQEHIEGQPTHRGR